MKKFYTILLITVFALASFVSYSQCAGSSNIFTFNYQGKKYEIVKENKSWTAAAACAVERGGYLVEINDIDEQDTIMNAIFKGALISKTYTTVADGGGTAYIWIGATDKKTEGAWIWDGNNDSAGINFWNGQGAAGAGGGTAVSGKYNNWGGKSKGTPNEPDDYGSSQDGGAIALDGWPLGTEILGVEGEWNDINLTNTIYYIIEYNQANGINQNSSDHSGIFIYPNPAANSLQLKLNQIQENSLKITIFDMLGKTVMEISDNNPSKNSFTKNIDTSTLQNGTYFLLVESDGKIQNTKFSILR
jgi:hypothetical protein